MNLLINLTNIKSRLDVEKYQMQIAGKSLLEAIINQTACNEICKIVILINSELEHMIKEHFESIGFNNIEYKLIYSQAEQKIARELLLDDVKRAYKLLAAIDIKDFLGYDLDYSQPLIILDARNLCISFNLSFKNKQFNSWIKIISDGKETIAQNVLFISKPLDIKQKLEIQTIKTTAVNLLRLDSLLELEHSKWFRHDNISLKYMIVLEKMSNLEFDEALKLCLEMVFVSKYWMLAYLELLLNFGDEQEFIEFYNTNSIYINKLHLTESQVLLYSDVLNAIDKVKCMNSFINPEVKEHVFCFEADLNYILEIIIKSDFPQANFSFLINQLITKQEMTDEHIGSLLKVIDQLEGNIHAKVKNIVDIADYTFFQKSLVVLNRKIIKQLYQMLHRYPELFGVGLENRLKIYNAELQIGYKCISGEPVSLSKNVMHNNIAVCISGMPTTDFRQNLKMIKHCMPPNIKVDYFVQMWDVYEEFPSLAKEQEGKDELWSNRSLQNLEPILPQSLKRRGNIEALFPETSKLLFTKVYSSLYKSQYIDVLGDQLKVIRKYKHPKMKSTKYNTVDNRVEADVRLERYFEKNLMQEILESYMNKHQVRYDYVINIDINMLLKSPLDINEFNQIQNDQVYLTIDEDGKYGGMTVSDFLTSRKVNRLWSRCMESNSSDPYVINGNEIMDSTIDLFWTHLTANKIDIKIIGSQFGYPHHSFAIQLPNLELAINKDLENYSGDVSNIRRFFKSAGQRYGSGYSHSYFYLITSAKLINYKLSTNQIELTVSITGNYLNKLNSQKLKLFGQTEQVSGFEQYRENDYKQEVLIRKHEPNEIVAVMKITDVELFNYQRLTLGILYDDQSQYIQPISIKDGINISEFTQYGLKYLKFDNKLVVGMDTKSFLLRSLIG